MLASSRGHDSTDAKSEQEHTPERDRPDQPTPPEGRKRSASKAQSRSKKRKLDLPSCDKCDKHHADLCEHPPGPPDEHVAAINAYLDRVFAKDDQTYEEILGYLTLPSFSEYFHWLKARIEAKDAYITRLRTELAQLQAEEA